MSDNSKLIKKHMKKDTLSVIVLNVGDGDANIIRFPPKYGNGNGNECAIVDCYDADKTIAALEVLKPKTIPFICATHPHYDHTKGLEEVIEWCNKNKIEIEEFWDSGFRHVSKTHHDIIRLLQKTQGIKLFYPTSGFETIINRVRVQVLSPSIQLKNRYDTFGTNINNASIVIKLEYPPVDIAPYYLSRAKKSDNDLSKEVNIKQHKIILGGDAQFDAWARITDEFPRLQSTSNRGQMIDTSAIKHEPLKCHVLKVPHHMSKHGISLEVLETLKPRYTIASCSNNSNHGFPHELTVMAAKDIRKKCKDNGIRYTGHPVKKSRSGTVVAMFPESRKTPVVCGLGETVSKNAPLPIIMP